MGAALALVPATAGAETLARWQFDEGAGQAVADSSGHGRSGQLGVRRAATDASDPTWIPGRVGHALRFDGARDEFVVISGASSIAPARLTVSAWVRRLGSPGTYRYVISNGASGCDQSAYGLYSGAGGGLTFYVSGTRGYVLSPAAGADRVWDGAWHLATGTYDGSAVRLYLDGAQVGSPIATALTIDYPTGGAAYIGTFRGNCDLPFTGDVDDLSISDGAARRHRDRPDRHRDAAATGAGGPARNRRGRHGRRGRIGHRPGRVEAGRDDRAGDGPGDEALVREPQGQPPVDPAGPPDDRDRDRPRRAGARRPAHGDRVGRRRAGLREHRPPDGARDALAAPAAQGHAAGRAEGSGARLHRADDRYAVADRPRAAGPGTGSSCPACRSAARR